MPPLRLIIVFSYACVIFEAATGDSSSNPKCLDGSIITPGWTIPRGDIELEVGHPLEIYCILDSTNTLANKYTADDIVFKKGSNKIDSKYVNVVNKTTARLYMENLPVSVEAEYVYCYLNLRGSDASAALSTPTSSLEMPATSEQMICLNSITIGCRPQDVANLTCISENWEVLKCTWIEPNNGVKTNYSIYYSVSKRAAREQFPCPTREPGKCVWFKNSNPPYRPYFETLNFSIYGANKFGNSSQAQRINHYRHVIPAPPAKLTAVSRTAHSVYLRFDIGLLETFPKGFIYRVKYTWNTSAFWNVNEYHSKDVERAGDFIAINVTDLKYPNVAYDFKIYMKSAIADDSEWSQPASVVARTSPSAPYRSPETDVGGFEILHKYTHSRDVLVYWKPIPDEEYNGDKFKYEITVFENDIQVNVVESKAAEKTHFQFNKLSFSSYKFVIKSRNDIGSAPSSSVVYLPKDEDVLPEPTLFTKVDLGDGVYELSWKVPNTTNEKVTNYTIFWCENNQGYPYRCDKFLNWTHLPANTFKHNFIAKPLVGYHFAISVNSMNSSSGMVWALCTVLRNQVNKIKHVLIGRVGSHYIDVEWKLDCTERVEGIKGYNITYCPVIGNSCIEPEKTYLIYGDVSTNHGNITGLTPYTTYRISVAIFTDKLLGPASEWLFNRTQDAAPDMHGIAVEVYNITDSTAVIKWRAPTNSNGILDHYEVYYDTDKKVIVNDTFVVLTGLRSYDMYHIRVVACTAVCSRTDPVALHTKIGAPGEVRKLSTEKLNAVDVKLKWEPPAVPAGPNPVYDVKIEFDDPGDNSTYSEFETKETEKIVKIPCNQEPTHSAYTFFVRARNTDDSDMNDVKQYVGPWSSAYTIDCMNGGGLPTTWKVLLILSLCTLSLSVFAVFGKKGISKCKEMKQVEVVLPAKFTISFPKEMKDTSYHVDIKSWTEPNEIDHLNKLSDADQSSIDCIDLDLDTDRETSRSSSGCYTS